MSSVREPQFVANQASFLRDASAVARLGQSSAVEKLDAAGGAVLRYGLVAILLGG